jgi:hypothetical protein
MPTNGNVDRNVLTRIRMEYIEMPDLRLTNSQASCLWNLDQASCDAILAALVEEQFLSQTGDGSYVMRNGFNRPAVRLRGARARHVD